MVGTENMLGLRDNRSKNKTVGQVLQDEKFKIGTNSFKFYEIFFQRKS